MQPPPSKRPRTSAPIVPVLADGADGNEVEVAAAAPTHPLDIKPAGNAFFATENLKAACGSFARLPDELISHMLEDFDADTLIRLGSTCKALYAFTRLDELWRALFIK